MDQTVNILMKKEPDSDTMINCDGESVDVSESGYPCGISVVETDRAVGISVDEDNVVSLGMVRKDFPLLTCIILMRHEIYSFPFGPDSDENIFVAGSDYIVLALQEDGSVDVIDYAYHWYTVSVSSWSVRLPSILEYGELAELVSATMSSNYAVTIAGTTVRHVLSTQELFFSSEFGFVITGDSIRITMPRTLNDWHIAECWVGHLDEGSDCDFDGNQVQMTYEGSTSTWVYSGGKVSDEVTFDFDVRKKLVVSVYFAYSQNMPVSDTYSFNAIYSAWIIAGNQAEDTNWSSPTSLGSFPYLIGIQKIEIGVNLQCPVAPVAVGMYHAVGVKTDGTCLTTGSDDEGQLTGISAWTDILSLDCGDYTTIGLKDDGTCVAVGDNTYGQCNVSSWTNIIQVVGGNDFTLGLLFSGTCVYAGRNGDGAYYDAMKTAVESWDDIVFIAGTSTHVIGLKSDGTCVAGGDNTYNQTNVSGWTDIIMVGAGLNFSVGLKSDGTCVAVGDNTHGQCDITQWTEIVQLIAGDESWTLGLRSDGTIVQAGLIYGSELE
jgi:hypothetical protein